MKHTAQDNAANKVIMVCVTGQRSCDQLIARGLERAGQGSSVHVVHCVETGRNFLNTPFESDAIEYLFTAAFVFVRISEDSEVCRLRAAGCEV